MNTAVNKTRTTEIVFPGQITDEEKGAIQEQILTIDPLMEIELDNRMMKVGYNLATARFSQIWQIVSNTINSKSFSFAKKLIYSLQAYIEDNEHDHLNFPCGWDDYTQSIFFNYYSRHVDRRRHKKLMWQKYLKDSNKNK